MQRITIAVYKRSLVDKGIDRLMEEHNGLKIAWVDSSHLDSMPYIAPLHADMLLIDLAQASPPTTVALFRQKCDQSPRVLRVLPMNIPPLLKYPAGAPSVEELLQLFEIHCKGSTQCHA